MHSQQITINSPVRQNAPFVFSLKIAGRQIERNPIQPPTIFVHCDLCSDHASGEKADLLRAGWGICRNHAFCPEHQAEV